MLFTKILHSLHHLCISSVIIRMELNLCCKQVKPGAVNHQLISSHSSFSGTSQRNHTVRYGSYTYVRVVLKTKHPQYEMSAPAPAAAPAPAENQPPPNLTSNRRLQQTQAQVDEVVDIMRVNVDKVLERDQKLSELDDRADALQAGASQFETSAAKLKNKYWWKNAKMMIILGVICVIVLIVIIVYFST
ncbi:synaptic vesicle-associated integral membrane protein [Arapaima gigas]